LPDIESLTIPAYAKINIGLKVLRKRSDDYHDLITIMQRISLCDQVTLILEVGDESRNARKEESKVTYNGPSLTADPADNLCVRAAKAFLRRCDIPCSVHIKLEKNIPIGAGLGGGSSDAAAVLVGLTRLYGKCQSAKVSKCLSKEVDLPSLLKIAVGIGSDVPFFIYSEVDASKHLYSYATLVQGRGEQLSPAIGLCKDKLIIIIWPGFAISTSWAYQKLDESLTFNGNNITLITCDFSNYRDGIQTKEIGNDFEIPIFAAYPELIHTRDRLLEAGALFAGLSGSGSAIYGVFDSEAEKRVAQLKWPHSWLSVVCRPC